MAGPLFLHDNARLHIVDVVTKKLHNYEWEVLPPVPYSPDTSPRDFDLFPKLNNLCMDDAFLLSKSFLPMVRYLSYLTHNKSGSWMLPKFWDSVIEKQEDYIEGLWTDDLKK